MSTESLRPEDEVRHWNAVTITFVVSDVEASEDETFSPLVADLNRRIQELSEDMGAAVKWVSTAVQQVPTMGAGQCTNCGAWTVDLTDDTRPGMRLRFSLGATVNGLLLCDLCLPEDHPLHF
ncbi:hypothetical protein [Deinococcus altitudinis]|uniref:hypothetical protein n=1 Tax=Deinococcus altitudinis TaxID=468914 RepID=UPI0038914116